MRPIASRFFCLWVFLQLEGTPYTHPAPPNFSRPVFRMIDFAGPGPHELRNPQIQRILGMMDSRSLVLGRGCSIRYLQRRGKHDHRVHGNPATDRFSFGRTQFFP